MLDFPPSAFFEIHRGIPYLKVVCLNLSISVCRIFFEFPFCIVGVFISRSKNERRGGILRWGFTEGGGFQWRSYDRRVAKETTIDIQKNITASIFTISIYWSILKNLTRFTLHRRHLGICPYHLFTLHNLLSRKNMDSSRRCSLHPVHTPPHSSPQQIFTWWSPFYFIATNLWQDLYSNTHRSNYLFSFLVVASIFWTHDTSLHSTNNMLLETLSFFMQGVATSFCNYTCSTPFFG